jgi:uncharacterized coiled-coil DUF342 family protein
MNSETIQTSVDNLYQELKELKEQNIRKKNEISLLKPQVDDTVRQRDALNGEVRTLSAKVRELKTKRDSLNAKVRELKQKRDEARTAASEKRATLSKLLEQAGRISEQLQGSMSELSKQVKRLEWYVQTTPLDPKSERNMVAKIGELEAKLAKHKGLRNVRDKLLSLKVEVAALRMQAQSNHQELTHLAEESEKVHSEMQEVVKLLTTKKKEADQKHTKYLEQSNQRHEAVSTLRKNLTRIEEIRSQIGEVKVSSKTEKAEKLKSKYKEAANEKLRTGGKLSFEEFQALMGDTLSGSEDE